MSGETARGFRFGCGVIAAVVFVLCISLMCVLCAGVYSSFGDEVDRRVRELHTE